MGRVFRAGRRVGSSTPSGIGGSYPWLTCTGAPEPSCSSVATTTASSSVRCSAVSAGARCAGSTTRGGLRALMEMARVGRNGHPLAITPDGPRGPRRVLQGGILRIAQRSRAPDPAARRGGGAKDGTRYWDRFLVPHPWSKLVAVAGERIWIPSEESSDALERSGGPGSQRRSMPAASARRTGAPRESDRDASGRLRDLPARPCPRIAGRPSRSCSFCAAMNSASDWAVAPPRKALRSGSTLRVWASSRRPFRSSVNGGATHRRFVVSCTNRVARTRIAERLPAGARVRLAPLDLVPLVARAMRRERPSCLIFVETEIWPAWLGARGCAWDSRRIRECADQRSFATAL